jgi:hypothetical protein
MNRKPATPNHALHLLIGLLLAVLSALPTWAQEPKIREFDLPTIEALGKELYRRDHMASEGTDLMLARHPEARQQPVKGWVSTVGGEASVVFFLQERDDRLSLAYTVTFPREAAPVVKDQIGEAVPEAVRTRYRARQTAIAAVPKLYTRNTNAEVLDDPDGDGFVVYVLASTTEPNEMVVGGHYRVTISRDGRKAEAVDALSRSLLILPINPPDAPKGAETVAAYMTHIVSPTPVETHVFVSLLHRRVFYVSTSETEIWKVADGKIEKTKLEE